MYTALLPHTLFSTELTLQFHAGMHTLMLLTAAATRYIVYIILLIYYSFHFCTELKNIKQKRKNDVFQQKKWRNFKNNNIRKKEGNTIDSKILFEFFSLLLLQNIYNGKLTTKIKKEGESVRRRRRKGKKWYSQISHIFFFFAVLYSLLWNRMQKRNWNWWLC